MKTATVIDYIVQRIADEGIEHCFGVPGRSEEHTSELQSRSDLVCRLLLEKKKKKRIRYIRSHVSIKWMHIDQHSGARAVLSTEDERAVSAVKRVADRRVGIAVLRDEAAWC